jgi:glycosyltransferase involved in cell wall biosynthesis
LNKLLVVSASVPPMGGGASTALGIRLRALPERSYLILTGRSDGLDRGADDARLPAMYLFLAESGRSLPTGTLVRQASAAARRSPSWLAPVGVLLRLGRDVMQLSIWRRRMRRRAEHIIQKEQPGGLLATSDDGTFLIASYQAARATTVPLYLLMLDIYAGNRFSLLKRVVARVYEPRILKYARKVFVTNPEAQAHYRRLYGIEAVVLSHPSPPVIQRRARLARRSPVIAYTGSVYWAQVDAIRNLVEALLSIPEAVLELVTEQNESDLKQMSLIHGRVHTRRATPGETRDLQKEADLLFLPLSFGNQARDLIRTSAPGKMAEYLVSGVPVLVHAPADSYVSRDATEHGWGFVVDRPDVRALSEGVRTLLSDDSLRARLVASALELARSRHDAATLGMRFREELGFDSPKTALSD